MQREATSILDVEEDIYEIASEFEDPVVRRYAAKLRDAGVTPRSFERSTIVEELVKAGIPEFSAADIADAFRKDRARGNVGVFWDLENIGLPADIRPMSSLTALRDVIIRKFGRIQEFKAYADLATFATTFPPETRVIFRDCGVEMVDAPHNRRKEVADKHIIVDALWFAMHAANPIVCIISGDSDFSPLMSKLKMSGVPTLVISTSGYVRSLREQAKWGLSWPEDFIAGASAMPVAPQRNRAGEFTHAYAAQPTSAVNPNVYRPSVSPRRGSPASVVPLQRTTTQPPPLDPTVVAPGSPVPVEGGTPKFSDHPAATPLMASTEATHHQQGSTHFNDLFDCIKQIQHEVGMKKVRRSAVGILFKRVNPVVPFKKVVVDAEAAGLVQLGGQLGHAWIALAADQVDADHTQNGEGLAASPNAASPATAPKGWWISLRYNQSFHCYGTLQSFRPVLSESLRVTRVEEPQGHWHRLAIGPFDSMNAADNYYTMNFGEMQLLPKITQNINHYMDLSQLKPFTAVNSS